MTTFKLTVSLGFVGCKRTVEFEVDDGELAECETPEARDQLVEEVARDELFGAIEWNWEEAD